MELGNGMQIKMPVAKITMHDNKIGFEGFFRSSLRTTQADRAAVIVTDANAHSATPPMQNMARSGGMANAKPLPCDSEEIMLNPSLHII